MKATISLLVFAGFLLAGPRHGERPDGDCPKEERKRLHGEWKVTRAVNDGEEVPKEELEELVMIFDGESIRIREGERVNEHFQYRLHLDKKPRGIDFHYMDGKKKGRVDRAIYLLEGKMLKICIQENPRGDRPREFSSRKGSERSLVYLQRKAE